MAVTSYGSPRTVYYVSAAAANDSGNGTTPSTPKKTIAAAKALAVAGDLIIVGGGTYNERDLAKDGVEYLFEFGAKVAYSGSAGGIFDDGGNAVTCLIRGHGDFYHSGASGNRDIFRVTNADSIFDVECLRLRSIARAVMASAGYCRIKCLIGDTDDGTFDCIGDGARVYVDVVWATSVGFVVESDGGRLVVDAKVIESTNSNPIEIAGGNAYGYAVVKGALIIAADGNGHALVGDGLLALNQCVFLPNDYVEPLSVAGEIHIINCSGVSESDVVLVGDDADVYYGSPVNVTAASAVSATVTPSASQVADRAGRNYILAYTAETNTVSVTVLDAGGDAVDLSAKTLGVYWETDQKVAVSSLTSGITISGTGSNVVTFAIPSAVTASERELIFAIRDQAAPKAVYAGGVFDVQYLPGP